MRNLIETLGASARLTREEIWHPDPAYIPEVRRDFALLPRPGFVGRHWEAGGSVLIGSNPGSTESHSAAESTYGSQDLRHSDLIRAFRDMPNEENYAALMNFERWDISTWSLRSTIDRVLGRLGVRMDDVAILNVVPFSTRNAPSQVSPVWRNSVAMHLGPLLHSLQPGRIVWLGKAASDGVRPHAHLLPTAASHIVSRQRNLTWDQKLKDLPDTRR